MRETWAKRQSRKAQRMFRRQGGFTVFKIQDTGRTRQETQETWVWSLGWKDPLEEEMATHSIVLAWTIPWTEKPGELESIVPQRVRHDWTNLACMHTLLGISLKGRNVLFPFSFPLSIGWNIHVGLCGQGPHLRDNRTTKQKEPESRTVSLEHCCCIKFTSLNEKQIHSPLKPLLLWASVWI